MIKPRRNINNMEKGKAQRSPQTQSHLTKNKTPKIQQWTLYIEQ